MSLVETMLRAEPGKFNLWPSVWKLLRLRVRIWWNGVRRAKLRSKIGTGFLLLGLLALMITLFVGSSLLLRFLYSPELKQYIDPTQFLGVLPTLILTMAFFITLVTNFGVLLQALYLSRDMDFLVTSPLPMRAVFLSKLLEAVLPNFALFCAFSLPVLFGLGVASHYSLLYYPLLVLLLVLLSLAGGGLASILVMAVVRVVPARRVAEVLGVLGALTSVLCGQSGNLINAMGVDRNDVGSALNAFSRLNQPWSPLAWAGQGLTAIGRAQWLPGLGLTLLSLALAGGAFAGTLYLAEQLYYTGWASMQGNTRRKRTRAANGSRGIASAAVPTAAVPASAASTPISAGATLAAGSGALNTATGAKPGFRLIPTPLRGMLVKDFLMLRRDLRNLSQLITPLIVGVVMLFSVVGGRGYGPRGGRSAVDALARTGLQNLEVYSIIGLSVFVGWMLMINLANYAFTREGRNYWMIKASPIRPLYLLTSKFIVSYLPAAVLSLTYVLLAFTLRGLSTAYLPYGLLVVALAIAGSCGIALAFGVAGANLDWDGVHRQQMRGWTGCVGILAVMVFMFIDVGLFFLPPGLWQALNGSAPMLAYILGIVIGGVAAALAVILPLWLVMGRLAHIGEKD